MKKIIYIVLSVAFVLVGCKDESRLIVDHDPVLIIIRVTDAKGVDILNQHNLGALEMAKIKAIYNGQELECKEYEYGRSYKPYFRGLILNHSYQANVYQLEFGEFEVTPKEDLNESVTIVWPDNSSDKIDISRTSNKSTWMFNNQAIQPNRIIKLVK